VALGAADAGGARARLGRALPVLTVLALGVALMYPVALWLGLPLARKRMENLANWLVTTTAAHPLAAVPDDPAAGAAPGARLTFGGAAELEAAAGAPERLVLVKDGAPLAAPFGFDGGELVLEGAVAGPLLTWGAELAGPLDEGLAPGAAGHLFRFADPAEAGRPLYLGGRLLEAGVVDAAERADGVTVAFTFPLGEGPVLVGERLVLEGAGFEADGQRVTLAAPPPFNAPVRRLTADYAVVDAASGTVALAQPSPVPPRAASGLALAELLVGAVDGVNRTFELQHVPLVENDPARRLMLDDRELSSAAERPRERVDGATRTFTFVGARGVVTVDGREAVEGVDYERDGAQVTFARPPTRNAQLRQYPDYLVSDPAAGVVTLAVAPQPGQRLWAASYTYYDRPACGATALDCFLSMPQHPMPFPHWIAQRLGPFLTAYPLADARNVVRATLYTAGGTLLALAVGALLGVLLAVVFVAVRPAERALLPWVIASQTVPIIALVPVLLLLLGNVGVTVQASLVPATLIGAYIAFFPVTVGTVTGLRSVDPLALDLMKSYAASPVEVFWKVRFPAAVPFFFTSLKLGAAAALVGALVAETESNNRFGLGYAIVGQVQAGNVADVWILLLISAALGIGLVALVGLAQRLIAPWERR